MIGLGQTSQLGIGIAVRLHDQFSREAKRVNQQLLDMRKNSQGALLSAMKDYRNQAASISAFAGAVTFGMYRMVEAASEYDHLINQIAIVGGRQLGKTRDDLNDFAQNLSSIFPNKPKEVAQAMFENVKAGVTDGLELITKYQIAVSTATNELVGGEQGVAAGLLGILNAMDLSTKEFPRVANAVSQAANISMASVNSINESMQYFANTAHAANLSLEDTLALIAKLSQANIRGSMGGTALSNMIRHLVQAAGPFAGKKKMAAWGMLGVDVGQVQGLINQGKIFDIITLMDKASQRLDYVTKENVFNQIFGVRGEKALINMFGNSDPNKTFQAMRDAIKEGVRGDIAMKQAMAMSDDPWADIKKMGNAIARFGIQFLNSAKPIIRVFLGIVEKLVSFGNWLVSTNLGKILAGLAVVAAPLITIMFAFRASALAATIALHGFSRAAAVGGFGSLLRGGLGMVGMSRLGANGANMVRNAAGRWTVAAGQTISHGGKIYKGGQILPSSFLAAMGLTGAGGTAAKAATGFFGKAIGWGGRVLGMFGKLLPVVGAIWMGVDILQGIMGLLHDQKEKPPPLDPVFQSYYRHLDEQLFGLGKSRNWYNEHGMSYGEYQNKKDEVPVLNQNLNINLDGTNVFNKLIPMQLEQSLNNSMNFEMPDF